MAIDIDRINPSVCFPTHELTEQHSHQFIGRRSSLRDAAQALLSPQRTIFIYGDRGMGKSSLAHQVAAIADGSNVVFKKEQFGVPDDGKRRAVFSLNAKSWMKTFDNFIWHLIKPSTLRSSFYQSYNAVYKDQSIARKFNISFNARLFDVASGSLELSPQASSVLDDLTLDNLPSGSSLSVFEEILVKIRDQPSLPEPVFLFDEVDRIDEYGDFGQFVKLSPYGRFIFVAATDSLLEFVADHESAARQVLPASIKIESMDARDIQEICALANKAAGGVLSFPISMKNFLEEGSFGYPWIVQNIGTFALRQAINSRSTPRVQRLSVRVPDLDGLFDHLTSLDDQPDRWKSLSTNHVQMTLLTILLDSADPLSRKQLFNLMPSGFFDDAKVILKRLCEAGILEETDRGFGFPKALHRLVCFVAIKRSAQN